MKKMYSIFTILFMVILFTGSSLAQQWSSEQKDVWAGVEKYWAVEASGDAQGFMSYFDDSYMGWSYQNKVPQSKSNVAKWIDNEVKTNTIVVYTLSPVSIWVKGEFAYVHYYYSELDKNKSTGKTEPSGGNWTDILMKKDGKWVLIGDHGGRTSKPE